MADQDAARQDEGSEVVKPLTRDEVIDRFRHEFFGWIADAFLQDRRGGELSLCLRAASAKIDAKIGEMYDSIVPPEKQPESLPVKPAPIKIAAGTQPTQPVKGR